MEILLTVQIIVVIALIAVILVQRSDSDGFTGNSSPSSFMTGRAQANLFTKTTAILATVFLVNSLVLGYLSAHTERTSDLIDSVVDEAKTEKENIKNTDKESKEVPTEEDASAPNKIEQIKKGIEANKPKEVEPSVPESD